MQTRIGDYELDHLVPLALGGHLRKLSNLMLQPWEGEHSTKAKDVLEVRAAVTRVPRQARPHRCAGLHCAGLGSVRGAVPQAISKELARVLSERVEVAIAAPVTGSVMCAAALGNTVCPGRCSLPAAALAERDGTFGILGSAALCAIAAEFVASGCFTEHGDPEEGFPVLFPSTTARPASLTLDAPRGSFCFGTSPCFAAKAVRVGLSIVAIAPAMALSTHWTSCGRRIRQEVESWVAAHPRSGVTDALEKHLNPLKGSHVEVSKFHGFMAHKTHGVMGAGSAAQRGR